MRQAWIATPARALLATLVSLVGCAGGGGLGWEDVEFDGPEGTDFLSFAPQADSIDLEDGYGDRFGSYAREDGYKIVDTEDHERARVKERLGKTSLRDPAGQTRLSTRDGISAEAMTC